MLMIRVKVYRIAKLFEKEVFREELYCFYLFFKISIGKDIFNDICYLI